MAISKGCREFRNAEIETHIQGGVIPPGGTTHGSAEPCVGGEIFPFETLRMAQGTEFNIMYDTIPAMTP